jgi:hypothetical protein
MDRLGGHFEFGENQETAVAGDVVLLPAERRNDVGAEQGLRGYRRRTLPRVR